MAASKLKHIILNKFFCPVAAAFAACVVLPLNCASVWAEDISNAEKSDVVDNSIKAQNAEAEEEDEFSGFDDGFPEEDDTPVPAAVTQAQAEEESVTPPAFTVTGIVWGTDRPQAIINDGIYGEGDIIEGTEAKIKKIDEEGILFEFKEKEFLKKRAAGTSAVEI